MNLPNKLTIIRVILVPFFLLFLLIGSIPCNYLLAFIVFALASITDALDGHIARSRNLITDFGKFLDPLADKMLTTAAFLGFIKLGIGWEITWIVFIVLFREFMIASLRLVTVSSGGKVVAANMWGKAKTVSQMAGIISALAFYSLICDFGISAVKPAGDIIISILLWISAVLCVVSGIIYLMACKDYIDPNK